MPTTVQRLRPQLAQIVRFALVGGVNTGTFYVGYRLLLHTGMPYFIAYTLAFIISMVGSFFMNTYFTYRTRPTWRKFLFFPLTNLTNYVVTSVGTLVLVNGLGLDKRYAPLLAAVAAIPFTYLLSKRILLRGHTDPATPAEGAGPPATVAGATASAAAPSAPSAPSSPSAPSAAKTRASTQP
ncbi:GtrA family protein [Phaeacidiphilus oryzae]|jgi:putative flippase GtrA|uniref:GtrA family protein n=1 Tax=Phaeacidiphilus oryzae TaxID=348818 RepID=UPI0009FCF485|nr:GtrA family protein [Phaeacidiphilus oryzae]